MDKPRKAILVLASYLALASLLSLFYHPHGLCGLSTVLGSTVLGSTVLGSTVISSTTVLGSTMLGTTSMVQVYSTVLPASQLAVSLLAIGILIFLELSDPAYGRICRVVGELRKSLLPLTVILVVLFLLNVAFRILAILG